MLILVKNKALISGCNADEIYNIQRYLTIDNPLFNQRVELGLGNWNVPNKLVYYEYDYDMQQITVPVGALPDLIGKNIISPNPEDILDLRTVGESPQFFSKLNFSGTLRDYQQEIIDACADKTMGVIEAMTGSGKTATFISLVMQRKLCTLILVNTIELANQTKEAFLKFTNATPDDIGFIGSGKFKLTPISICLHQTMAHASDEVFKLLNTYYGMVIADEVLDKVHISYCI